jgi:hypothetical protein
MAYRTLSDSCYSHIVNASLGRVDLADWLLHLTDAEYQRCSPAHIAAGTSIADDGQRVSIQVETIGDSLIIHQYVAELADPHRCRMISTSDVFSGSGRTTSEVVWDLSVEPLDDESCEYINHITATATDEFLALIERRHITFDQVAGLQDEAYEAHNNQETPRFAESIERRALSTDADR